MSILTDTQNILGSILVKSIHILVEERKFFLHSRTQEQFEVEPIEFNAQEHNIAPAK